MANEEVTAEEVEAEQFEAASTYDTLLDAAQGFDA